MASHWSAETKHQEEEAGQGVKPLFLLRFRAHPENSVDVSLNLQSCSLAALTCALTYKLKQESEALRLPGASTCKSRSGVHMFLTQVGVASWCPLLREKQPKASSLRVLPLDACLLASSDPLFVTSVRAGNPESACSHCTPETNRWRSGTKGSEVQGKELHWRSPTSKAFIPYDKFSRLQVSGDRKLATVADSLRKQLERDSVVSCPAKASLFLVTRTDQIAFLL